MFAPHGPARPSGGSRQRQASGARQALLAHTDGPWSKVAFVLVPTGAM